MLEVDSVGIGRRSVEALDRRLAVAQGARPTYAHVGSTLVDAPPPPGVPEHTAAVEAPGTLAAAARALHRWAAHDGIHAHVHNGRAPLEAGTTVLVVAPFGPFEMAVPNRVVGVVDEPRRFGFAYGTLDGHAETGEERFLAEDLGDGCLRLSVRIHARPGSRLARLGRPVVRRLQDGATRRYLAAWAAAIAADPGR